MSVKTQEHRTVEEKEAGRKKADYLPEFKVRVLPAHRADVPPPVANFLLCAHGRIVGVSVRVWVSA